MSDEVLVKLSTAPWSYFVLEWKLATMTRSKRFAYHKLHNTIASDGCKLPWSLSTWQANAFGLNDNEQIVASKICKLNHSCSPNAMVDYAVGSDRLTVRASQYIEPGTEITISYLDPLLPSDQRQKMTQFGWSFECKCETCTLPEDRLLWSKRTKE